MTIADNPPPRNVLDNIMRETLRDAKNLSELLHQVVPEIADRFQYDRMEVLESEFSLDDWHQRGSDLLVQLPYLEENGEAEPTLVCVLVEHQSDSDARMALRTLLYAVLYWEREWRAWEATPVPREEFQLTPVVPVVFHTGSQRWRAIRSLSDLMRGPQILRDLAPRWEPILWDLADQDLEQLLQCPEHWLKLMAIIRGVGLSATEFMAVYRRAIRHLGTMSKDRKDVRWSTLIRAVLSFAFWRRPAEERPSLIEEAEKNQQEVKRKERVQSMGKTIAESLIQEGWAEGKLEGKAEGKAEGKLEGKAEEREASRQRHLQRILRQGKLQFGTDPDTETVNALEAISNPDLLIDLLIRIATVESWQQLLEQSKD